MDIMSDLPIACTLTEAQMRERRETVLKNIRSQIMEVRELPDGYAFRFEAGDEQLDALARMINLERKCCAFLRFALTMEPGGGPLWLEITGPGAAKPFLRAELAQTE
jgi:hypothetical protein